jgi:hypothetical protein
MLNVACAAAICSHEPDVVPFRQQEQEQRGDVGE